MDAYRLFPTRDGTHSQHPTSKDKHVNEPNNYCVYILDVLPYLRCRLQPEDQRQGRAPRSPYRPSRPPVVAASTLGCPLETRPRPSGQGGGPPRAGRSLLRGAGVSFPQTLFEHPPGPVKTVIYINFASEPQLRADRGQVLRWDR